VLAVPHRVLLGEQEGLPDDPKPESMRRAGNRRPRNCLTGGMGQTEMILSRNATYRPLSVFFRRWVWKEGEHSLPKRASRASP
jgi:hypothetical protein